MGAINEDIRVLRLHVGVNLFKCKLLGDKNVIGKIQSASVLRKFPAPLEEQILCENTWRSWFSDKPITMKVSKAKALDEVAAEEFGFGFQDKGKNAGQPLQFFEELVLGGLVSKMLVDTKPENARQELKARADEYIPISILHLHLDSIEINTITNDFHDVSWAEVAEIAAQRVLNLLSELWGPRSGLIYSDFSSPLKLQWDMADDSERKNIRDYYARLKPDMFEEKYQEGAYPDWELMGVDNGVAPQHIYKVLFVMAADADFLVEDRLSEWVSYLAISAFAMRALAWSDRYNTFGMKITDEVHFWSAFEHLFFDVGANEVDELYVYPAMKCCSAEWCERSLEIFSKARKEYQAELHKNGILPQEISHIVNFAAREHPVVYRG